MQLVFEACQADDGGYFAECSSEEIFTEADRWESLRANVREATQAFYFDRKKPESIRLRLVRDEVLTV